MKQDIDLKEINENRSKRLKESRIEKGLSITEVSKMIGVNQYEPLMSFNDLLKILYTMGIIAY